MSENATEVYGQTVDEQTRCVHYQTELDVIAIKFVCCDRYYPCFECHAADADHTAEQWPRSRWSEAAILCGGCRAELSVDEYKRALAAVSPATETAAPGPAASEPAALDAAPKTAACAEPAATASAIVVCPRCGIEINPRCSLHSHLYFES